MIVSNPVTPAVQAAALSRRAGDLALNYAVAYADWYAAKAHSDNAPRPADHAAEFDREALREVHHRLGQREAAAARLGGFTEALVILATGVIPPG